MALKTIEVEFDLKEMVYVKTDEKQLPRIIQGYLIYPGEIKYFVCLNENANYFYDFELSREKSFLQNNKSSIGFQK